MWLMKVEKMMAKMMAVLASRGWTATDLEVSAGLPKNRITKWKKGGEPTARQALAIARALGVPLEWLADDTLDYPPPPTTAVDLMARFEEPIRILGVTEAWRRLLRPPEGESGPIRHIGSAVFADKPQHPPSPEGLEREHEVSNGTDRP